MAQAVVPCLTFCTKQARSCSWAAMEDDFAHPYEEIERFTTYEDYLDYQITPTDRFYLEEDELARQLVEIGCRKGEVLSREEFLAPQNAPKVLASAQKDLSDFPFLRHLA